MTQKELMKFIFVGGFLTYQNSVTEMSEGSKPQIEKEHEIVDREFDQLWEELKNKGILKGLADDRSVGLGCLKI